MARNVLQNFFHYIKNWILLLLFFCQTGGHPLILFFAWREANFLP